MNDRPTAIDLIAAERARQIAQEGYDAEHDRGHADELARAAATYALPENRRETSLRGDGSGRGAFECPVLWPWNVVYWKPTPKDRVRELVKAGALIAAAIDSLAGSCSLCGRPLPHMVSGETDRE